MSHPTHSGLNDLRARVEAKLAGVSTQTSRHVATPSWPSGMGVLRVAGSILLAIVVIGWVLSAIN
ncbi:MAG TPA: hypothetical protein VEX62_05735 [Candidatus Limnocylindrales bacterium]|nr:hypothetical protein [Candidatus Limnocylindrales bacterium]